VMGCSATPGVCWSGNQDLTPRLSVPNRFD
jgi:hypothetical protein